MLTDYLSLLRDTIAHLKQCASPWLATPEEWKILSSPLPKADMQKNSAPPRVEIPPSPPLVPAAKKAAQKTAPQTPLIEKTHSVSGRENRGKDDGPIKNFLKTTSLILSDSIPDDRSATRMMSAWQEYIGDVDIAILYCQRDAESLAMVKNLCKSIHQKLGKVKILSAERLEQEQRWDLFLTKNSLKCIIATEGFIHFKEAIRYYKDIPAHSTRFFGTTPLIILSSPEVYAKSPKEKINVWNQIGSLLKR